jgi:hypothetical protein
MPHLITTTGTRIPLHTGEGYVMGRGRDCDIVVEDLACSRRHALLTLDNGANCAFVEDLNSRNGTYLNGERLVAKAPLKQGSRIRIGATVYLVHLYEEAESSDFADTGTVGFEHHAEGSDLDGGELSQYGIVELLKLLIHSRRNLTLHVALPDDNAQVELRDGEVMAAACGGLSGFNALVKMGRAPSGIFWVVHNEGDFDCNVQEPSGHLLVELARCLGTPSPAT